MSIVIDKNLVGVWFIPFTTDADWMGAITRCGDGTYELNYRFRYYVDDLTGPDSKDTKHWYNIKAEATNDEEVASWVRSTTNMLASALGDGVAVTELLMHNGDVEAFAAEMMKQDFAHMQTGVTCMK